MSKSRNPNLSFAALLILLVTASCAIPTGHYRKTTVIAQRLDSAGKPEAVIREEETVSKRFYPFTADGPFVSKAWPNRFEYRVMDQGGQQTGLPFLTTHEVREQFLAFFPISNGRWIGINPQANAPVSDSLKVCVFNTRGILSSNVVAGCYHNEYAALRALSASPPLRSTIRFYDYEFNSSREDVRFRTRAGDFVFDANNGSLKKVANE